MDAEEEGSPVEGRGGASGGVVAGWMPAADGGCTAGGGAAIGMGAAAGG